MNKEKPLMHTISIQGETRVQGFCDAVRSRNGGCVTPGTMASSAARDKRRIFEATHIFPLPYESIWKASNYSRWILNPPNREEIYGGKFNSVQNGLLLQRDIHALFDS